MCGLRVNVQMVFIRCHKTNQITGTPFPLSKFPFISAVEPSTKTSLILSSENSLGLAIVRFLKSDRGFLFSAILKILKADLRSISHQPF